MTNKEFRSAAVRLYLALVQDDWAMQTSASNNQLVKDAVKIDPEFVRLYVAYLQACRPLIEYLKEKLELQ